MRLNHEAYNNWISEKGKQISDHKNHNLHSLHKGMLTIFLLTLFAAMISIQKDITANIVIINMPAMVW
jgi:hypothetical protein